MPQKTRLCGDFFDFYLLINKLFQSLFPSFLVQSDRSRANREGHWCDTFAIYSGGRSYANLVLLYVRSCHDWPHVPILVGLVHQYLLEWNTERWTSRYVVIQLYLLFNIIKCFLPRESIGNKNGSSPSYSPFPRVLLGRFRGNIYPHLYSSCFILIEFRGWGSVLYNCYWRLWPFWLTWHTLEVKNQIYLGLESDESVFMLTSC